MERERAVFAALTMAACSGSGPDPHSDVMVPVPGAAALASADVDGDGAPDLIAAAGDDVFVLANTGAGSNGAPSFGEPVNITPTATCSGSTAAMCFLTPEIAVADFDGDGRPDLAMTNAGPPTGSGTIRIFTNATPSPGATPTFAAPVELATGYGANSAVAIGDFNQDGKPDVAAWGAPNADRTTYSIAVFLDTTPAGATTPTFGARVDVPAGLPYVGAEIRVADVNRDAIPDLIAVLHDPANSRNLLGIMVGTTLAGGATATFAPAVVLDLGAADATAAGPIAISDFDGDGAVDLIANHADSPTVSVLHNTSTSGGTPSFTDGPIQIGDTALDSVTAQDVDGDGAPDLVATTYRRVSTDPLRDIGTIAVRRNSTASAGAAPSFADEEHRDVTANGYPGDIAIADFNGDGHADVAVALSGIAIDLGPW